jgi:hypothetical protein
MVTNEKLATVFLLVITRGLTLNFADDGFDEFFSGKFDLKLDAPFC